MHKACPVILLHCVFLVLKALPYRIFTQFRGVAWIWCCGRLPQDHFPIRGSNLALPHMHTHTHTLHVCIYIYHYISVCVHVTLFIRPMSGLCKYPHQEPTVVQHLHFRVLKFLLTQHPKTCQTYALIDTNPSLQHSIQHRQCFMYACVLAVHGLVLVRKGPDLTTTV